MEISTDLAPDTVAWTDNDEKALTILQAKKLLVQRIHHDDLLAWVKKNCPLEDVVRDPMSDDDLVALLVKSADMLIEMLAVFRKTEE